MAWFFEILLQSRVGHGLDPSMDWIGLDWIGSDDCNLLFKAMRDEGVIYFAGHHLLNRRCTRLPGCFYSPNVTFF